MEDFRIFISWSEPRSKEVAEALSEWLPNVIQSIKPVISEHDIEKGSLWRSKLAKLLHETKFGIICLTPENQENPWILFEAGALSKDENPLWTVLFGFKKSDVKGGPLSDINHTSLDEPEDVKRLLSNINNKLEDQALSSERLDKAFAIWWPMLEGRLKKIELTSADQPQRRPIEEMVEEILDIVRSLNVGSPLDKASSSFSQSHVDDQTKLFMEVLKLVADCGFVKGGEDVKNPPKSEGRNLFPLDDETVDYDDLGGHA